MDKMYVVSHTHFDAAVFKTREEYLEWGITNLVEFMEKAATETDYKFVVDQIAYFKPFLERYPELKDKFQKLIDEGKMEIVGGMYIMPDVNIPSGESLIRQILVGKQYCEQELGIDVKTGWMIDTFGHHPQMPQIMDKSGFDSYVFGRVTEEDISEFFWEGIDGSQLLCHWMPLHYAVFMNSPVYYQGFKEFVNERYQSLKEYAVTDNIIALEGADLVGPVTHTPAMIRKYNEDPERIADLRLSLPSEFFRNIKEQADKLSVVNDDFNPLFQGCYSARIEVKQWNKKLENLFRTSEFLNTVACKLTDNSRQYLIDKAWEPVLFNQVHDVICGVETDEVFANTMCRFKKAEFLAGNVQEESLNDIMAEIDTSGEGIPLTVFNQLGWQRKDFAEVPVGFVAPEVFDVGLVDSEDRPVPCQLTDIKRYQNGSIKQARVQFIAEVPALGYEAYRVIPHQKNEVQTEIDSNEARGRLKIYEGILENEYYRLETDLWTGQIKSIKLKETGEEFVNPELPIANTVIKETDDGDFWEIGAPLRAAGGRPINRLFPLPDRSQAEYSVDHGGTGYVSHDNIKAEFSYNQESDLGSLTTRVTLYSGVKRIDINTTLVNEDKGVRYRVIFPTTIKEGSIVNEIPFGALKRPEGEFPVQNWLDYADGDKGLGLLNCGLPGNGVVDNNIFLSVLKCTSFVQYGNAGGYDPSSPADEGYEIGKKHSFKYALVPHEKGWQEAELYRSGLALNNPLIVRKSTAKSGNLPAKKSFIEVDKSNIVINTVKQNQGNLIVRLYEAAGRDTEDINLTLAWPITSVVETDLIEKDLDVQELTITEDNELSFDIGQFEVKTFKISVK